MRSSRSPAPTERGFTLIELMVTVALAAVLLALAAPSMQSFVQRSRMQSVGNEFNASLLRVRNDAISKNICVSMCMSSTTDNATPVCSTTGGEWQTGWIGFLNAACDTTLATPAAADLLFVRRPSGADYQLKAATEDNRRIITFNPRGNLAAAGDNVFTVQYQGDPNNEVSRKYGYKIILSAIGRTRTTSIGSTATE